MMPRNKGPKRISCGILFFVMLVFSSLSFAQERPETLSLEQFVAEACQNDSQFQVILAREIGLEFREILALPVNDILLQAGLEYGITLRGEQQPQVTASLARLFPAMGSRLDFSLSGRMADPNTQQMQVTYAVDVVRNAFGHTLEAQKLLAGSESELVRVQVVEAYEDYLAFLISLFFDWVTAFENLRAAEAARSEAEKLLQNLRKMKRRHVAYQVDVDKSKIQYLGRERRVLQSRERFFRHTYQLQGRLGRRLRPDSVIHLVPDTLAYHLPEVPFPDSLWDSLYQESRRVTLLQQAESQDSLAWLLAQEELKPRIQIYGIGKFENRDQVDWEDFQIGFGIRGELSLGKNRERAQVRLLEADRERSQLATQLDRRDVHTDLFELSHQMKSRKELIRISQESLALARGVLVAEMEEYRFGRATLNELIQAQNAILENRQTLTTAAIELDRLRLEWYRLLDRLVVRMEEKGIAPSRRLTSER